MAGAVCSRLRGGPGAGSISSFEGMCGLVDIDCGVCEYVFWTNGGSCCGAAEKCSSLAAGSGVVVGSGALLAGRGSRLFISKGVDEGGVFSAG